MPLSQQHARTRFAVFFLCCLLAVTLVPVVSPALTSVFAQEPAPEGNPPAPAPAPSGEHKQTDNIILHMLYSIGWIMGPIFLILSMGLVFLVVLMIMDLRMGDAVPPAFVEEFTDTVNKRKFKDAFEMAKNDNSYLAKVLATGMARLQYGIEDAREAAFNTVESLKASKEQFITYMGTIGTVGPLLGLVGTVYSMIGAFMQMGAGTAKPADLAKTLSHGLVVTLVGIGIAVPSIFCHAFFRNRLIKISMETANVADDLLTQMYHNSRKPGAPGDTATVNAAPAAIKPAK